MILVKAVVSPPSQSPNYLNTESPVILTPIVSDAPAIPTAHIPFSERSALQSLYSTTMGNYWTVYPDEIKWDFSSNLTNPCVEKWIGILCSIQNSSNTITLHIVSIDLSNRNLIGILPSDLVQLSWLRNLQLNNNNLHGKIPMEVNKLTNLQSMDVSNNFLTGQIPMFGEMINLIHLNLAFNLLTSLTTRHNATTVSSFEDLFSLEYLNICNNPLEGSLGNFKYFIYLKSVYICNTNLAVTVPQFESSTKLQIISLYNNQFIGSIPQFSNLVNIV